MQRMTAKGKAKNIYLRIAKKGRSGEIEPILYGMWKGLLYETISLRVETAGTWSKGSALTDFCFLFQSQDLGAYSEKQLDGEGHCMGFDERQDTRVYTDKEKSFVGIRATPDARALHITVNSARHTRHELQGLLREICAALSARQARVLFEHRIHCNALLLGT